MHRGEGGVSVTDLGPRVLLFKVVWGSVDVIMDEYLGSVGSRHVMLSLAVSAPSRFPSKQCD